MSLYNKMIDLQKLQNAWRMVYKNKPKEGVDLVTYEEFEQEKTQQIKSLWKELAEHTYQCQPVHLVPLYKGEKVRYITLYTMRDKVIQYSIARELSAIYEPYLSDCCYAYRNGRSALQAAQIIEKSIQEMEDGYVLRTDIHAFFDCIDHTILMNKLRKRIKEEDVLELIQNILCTPVLEKNGELTEKKCGVYQGATIAPVLSNIYMQEFDRKIENEVEIYVRYSDDMLLLFRDENEVRTYKQRLILYIEELGLDINEEKTKILSFAQGFEFLGYRFDKNGITAPDKAEAQLEERLENIWMNPQFHTVEQRLDKGLEILNGWEQYFTGNREIHSILEYAVWIRQTEKKKCVDIDKAQMLRERFENQYKDIVCFLAGFWKKNHLPLMELAEYEQFYMVKRLDIEKKLEEGNAFLQELLQTYEKCMIQETSDLLAELIQLYSDLKMYKKAERFQSRVNEQKFSISTVKLEDTYTAQLEEIRLDSEEMNRYMELFVGREDLYALDELDKNQRRHSAEVLQPVTVDSLQKHFRGTETINTYIQRTNGTVKYLILDLDISKGILLQCKDEDQKIHYLKKCLTIAVGILKELSHLGVNGYLEQSGCRGYHIWIFFTEWLPVRYANLLADIIEQKTGALWKESEIQVEYLPNKTRLKKGKRGQTLKLPWGIHPKSGNRSCFLDTALRPYVPQTTVLKEIVQYPLNTIKRIISAHQDLQAGDSDKMQEVDRDLQAFEPIGEVVRVVLASCNLLRYLCQKSRKAQYLTHFERLTVLYVFGHLGEEGKEFVHKVMSFTLNYSYQTTQKFINRLPEKPVSCLKLREQYKQISAEIGCSCDFKRTKNCYPSPVLHAIKNADENCEVTIPVSKSVTPDKQKLMKQEMNAGSKAQAIAEKMLELRKQKRNLDKALRKCEQELEEIFSDENADSMEIKMGLLVRRKQEGKTEWVIEL